GERDSGCCDVHGARQAQDGHVAGCGVCVEATGAHHLRIWWIKILFARFSNFVVLLYIYTCQINAAMGFNFSTPILCFPPLRVKTSKF
ncbi:hypothetical protein BC830DRAFT_732352, partial [Chytriomyces sp. MP71]